MKSSVKRLGWLIIPASALITLSVGCGKSTREEAFDSSIASNETQREREELKVDIQVKDQRSASSVEQAPTMPNALSSLQASAPMGQNWGQNLGQQGWGQQNLGRQAWGQQNLGQQAWGQQNQGQRPWGQNLGQQAWAQQGMGQNPWARSGLPGSGFGGGLGGGVSGGIAGGYGSPAAPAGLGPAIGAPNPPYGPGLSAPVGAALEGVAGPGVGGPGIGGPALVGPGGPGVAGIGVGGPGLDGFGFGGGFGGGFGPGFGFAGAGPFGPGPYGVIEPAMMPYQPFVVEDVVGEWADDDGRYHARRRDRHDHDENDADMSNREERSLRATLSGPPTR